MEAQPAYLKQNHALTCRIRGRSGTECTTTTTSRTKAADRLYSDEVARFHRETAVELEVLIKSQSRAGARALCVCVRVCVQTPAVETVVVVVVGSAVGQVVEGVRVGVARSKDRSSRFSIAAGSGERKAHS